MASLIAVVIVAAVTVFGRNVSGLFLVPASVFNP
jgi:Flp pilus assembly pilin Flp